jgi:hypothetical protein
MILYIYLNRLKISSMSSAAGPAESAEPPEDILIMRRINELLHDASTHPPPLTKAYITSIHNELSSLLVGYHEQAIIYEHFSHLIQDESPLPGLSDWQRFCISMSDRLHHNGRLSRIHNSPFFPLPVGHKWESQSPAGRYPPEIIDDPFHVSCKLTEFLRQFDDVTEHCVHEFDDATGEYDKDEINELSKQFMSKQQKIIDSMFTAFDKHDLRDTLYAGYRVYLLVYSCCCICHDRIARVIVDALMADLIGFQELTGHDDTNELCEKLIIVYKSRFNTSRSGNSVSQSTCRKAGEEVIQVFREWLDKHGVTLDESVVIYMKDRFEAKHTIAKLQEIIDENSEMEDDKDNTLLFKFMNENHHSVFDAVGNILKKYAVSIGKPTIDAARTNVVGAPFVVFESCSFEDDSFLGDKPYVSLKETASIWDATEGYLTTSDDKRIPSLSVGVAALVSLLPFDVTKVDQKVIEILDQNPNSHFFTPVMLHYRHSGLMGGVEQNDQTDFFHDAKLYFEEHNRRCFSEFKKLFHGTNYPDFYTLENTDLHSHVLIDGQPYTLVALSRNALSNNVTGKHIDNVVAILSHSLRGDGCGDACGDFVFMGEGKRLRDKNGNPTPIGRVVAAINWWAKQFGDLSKEFLLLLIHILTGKMGLFATPDKMAATDFGIHGPTMVVAGNIIEVRALASSLEIDGELQNAIAQLQARIEMYISERGENSLNQLLRSTYNKDITLLKDKLNNLIKQQIETKKRNAVPGVIATCAFVDTLSDPMGLVVSKKQQKKYCKNTLNRTIHRAVTAEAETFFNLFQRPDVYPTLVSCVGNLQSALAVKRTWRVQTQYSGLAPTNNLADYIEYEILKEISFGKLKSQEMIQERYMQFIDEQLFGPFELFTQLENFENKYEKSPVMTRPTRSNSSSSSSSSSSIKPEFVSIKPDFGSMDIPAKVKSKILQVLTEYVNKNTTVHREYCLQFIQVWIGGDASQSDLLGLDLVGMSESAWRLMEESSDRMPDEEVQTQCDGVASESIPENHYMSEDSDTHNPRVVNGTNSDDDMCADSRMLDPHAAEFVPVAKRNATVRGAQTAPAHIDRRSYRDAVRGAQTAPAHIDRPSYRDVVRGAQTEPARSGPTQPSANAGVTKVNQQNAHPMQQRLRHSPRLNLNSRGDKNQNSTGQGKGRSGSGSTQNYKTYKREGGSRKKNKHNITKKYRTKTRKSRQTRRNKHKYKHTRTIKRRNSRRNNRN